MNELDAVRQQFTTAWRSRIHPSQTVIFLGTASCGRAAGALETRQAILDTLQELGIQANLIEVGCIGPCYLEPLMDVAILGLPRISYANVTPAKAKRILKACLVDGDLQPALAAGHFGSGDFTAQSGIPRFFDLPMLKPQVRIILKNCGLIDPEDLGSALDAGAYTGLAQALAMGPEQVIHEVKLSGLRGRGGAGFGTWKKWDLTRAAQGHPKYVVCNADEGDPGAFMNRALLEGDPHAVLEGITIGGFAVGASEGIIYVRAEYPLAVERLRLAIRQSRETGLLG